MLIQSKNIIGGGDIWAADANGGVQVQSMVLNAESVVFTNVPAVETNGYELFADTATSATANTAKPKQIGEPTFALQNNGTYTVTFTITKITAAQAGGKFQLRVFR